MQKGALVNRMIISLLLVFAGTVLPVKTTFVLAQELIYATRAGGTYSDEGLGIDVDGANNTLVTGVFNETVIFGAGEFNETELLSVGSDDIFIAKYLPDGSLLWATQAGGAASDGGVAIAVDKGNNILVTGSFVLPATFGAGEPNETTLMSGEVFVAKYASDGTLIWVKQAEGNGYFGTRAIAVDTAGRSIVTGLFTWYATFGAGEPNETTLWTVSAAEPDIFVAKYASNGRLLWARQAGGVLEDVGNGIAVDAAGNIVVSGYFYYDATFGAGEPGETTLEGLNEVFVAKYSPFGSLVWARATRGNISASLAFASGVAIDSAGNSLVTGYFNQGLTFGLGEPNETTLVTANLHTDMFVAKYTQDGTLVWAKQAGGLETVVGAGIDVNAMGSSVVAGKFSGTAIFGEGDPNEVTLQSAGSSDVFVASYGENGALRWASSAGGLDSDSAQAAAVDAAGNSLVTGDFRDMATFGEGEPDETTLQSAGETDIFVAKWGQTQEEADVFLTKLQAPRVLRLRSAITHARILVQGDGDTAPQDANVSLSVDAPMGVTVEVDPETVSKLVVPGNPLTRFAFQAEIECQESGVYEVQWNATIDADENSEPSNDTVAAETKVRCGD